MVARLNNDTMRFYRPPQAGMVPSDPERWSDDVCLALFGDGEGDTTSLFEAGALPLFRKAKAILGKRLQFVGEDEVTLDGRPVATLDMVAAANAVIRRTGGRYLPYPGIRPNHQRQGMGMNV